MSFIKDLEWLHSEMGGLLDELKEYDCIGSEDVQFLVRDYAHDNKMLEWYLNKIKDKQKNTDTLDNW